MQIKPTSPVLPPARIGSANQEQSANKQAEANSQRALAQVLSQSSGTTLVKTLPGGQTLELQTNQQLRAGQLVVLEQTPGQLKLETQAKVVADQLLRILLPHSGNLKPALIHVLRTALSQQTAPNSTTTNQQVLNQLAALGQNSGLTNLTNSAAQSPLSSSLSSQLQTLAQALLNNTHQPGSSGTSSEPQGNLLQQIGQFLTANSRQPVNQPLSQLLSALPQTRRLTEPAQVAQLLQSPSALSPLVKLILPLLTAVLVAPPTTTQEQERRQEILPRLNQLLARAILSTVRAPGSGLEAEVGRGEHLSRHDNGIDSLSFQLGIVRERNGDDEKRQPETDHSKNLVRRWTVRLAFDFEELGLITAYVVLMDNRSLEMNFWAERAETRQKIEAYQQQFHKKLNQVLSAHGIERLAIDVHEGQPPPAKPQVTTQLVDELA